MKSAAEGSEVQLQWPAKVATRTGKIRIDGGTLRVDQGRGQKLAVKRGCLVLVPTIRNGDQVEAKRTIVAAPIAQVVVPCQGGYGVAAFIRELQSSDPFSIRAAAAKALGALGNPAAISALLAVLNNAAEDPYLRLEAAAALTKLNTPDGWDYITTSLEDADPEMRLEVTIVLSDLAPGRATPLLIDVLEGQRACLADSDAAIELQGAAAWALGQQRDNAAIDPLIAALAHPATKVRGDAAEALRHIGDPALSALTQALESDNLDRQAGAAWVLSKLGASAVPRLLQALGNPASRPWAMWALGQMGEAVLGTSLSQLSQDHEAHTAVQIMWSVQKSWIRDLD